MIYKELKKKIKTEQKSLALLIRNGKSGRKPKNQNTKNMADWERLECNQDQYRHQHIVYCTLFNKTPYDLIEQPRENNKPSTYFLDKLKKEWEEAIDKTNESTID